IFRLRGLRQSASEGVPFRSFFDAMSATCEADDPVIEWDGVSEWAILDLDFHKGFTPDANDIRQAADTLRPLPLAWWISRSGGLHALYSRQTVSPAAELAACAALALTARFPTSTVEIKRSTRRPPGDVVYSRPTAETGITRLSGVMSADDLTLTSWLEDRDLIPGQRYPHDRCPVCPDGSRARGNAPPVCVYEDHIYCFICAADGVRRGCRTAGYFPLAKLCG